MIQRFAQFWHFIKRPVNSFSTIFCKWFFKQNETHIIFNQLTKFHCLIAFTSWKMGNMYIAIICFRGCDVINFELTSSFKSMKIWQKVKTKIKISWEQNKPLRWNKKHFSSFLKGLQLPKLVSDLRVRL